MKDIKYILMRYPSYIEIKSHSNRYKDVFSKEKALNDYNNLLNILTEEGVKYYFLNTTKESTEVYTRDLGFTIENILFISNLKSENRNLERKELINYAKKNKIEHYIFENNIEGGDVIVGNGVIFVGISKRTSQEGINELEKYIKERGLKYKVITINFDFYSKVHLDCVFNLVDKKTAIVSDYVFNKEDIEKEIKSVYNVSKESADNLGVNFLPIGKKRVICSDIEVMRILKRLGYKILYCEFDEIIKVNGGIRCSTLPFY